MSKEFEKLCQEMVEEDLAKELDELDEREEHGETIPMSQEMETIIGQDEQMSDIYERLAAESENKKRTKVCDKDGLCVEFIPNGEKPEGEEDEEEDTWSPPDKQY